MGLYDGAEPMAPRFRFFNDQLPDDSARQQYDQLESGIRQWETCVDLRRGKVQTHSARQLLEYVYNDHPEFFALCTEKCSYTSGRHITVTLAYRYARSECMRLNAGLEQATDDILKKLFPCSPAAFSELEREKRIYDWITDNIVYDKEAYAKLKTGASITESMAWNAYGALVLRQAVCWGIACGFKLLCDRAGLPCIVVLGDAGERHAWNIVRVQGRFYHVDCTWTLKASSPRENPFARYQYFNLPDEIILRTHHAECTFLPRCGSLRYNPYMMKGLCVNAPEQLFPMILDQAKAGKKRFALMCVGFTVTDEMAVRAANKLKEIGKYGQIKYHWSGDGSFIGFSIGGRNRL